MGFRKDNYATVWGTTIYEKYTVVELSTSKKNKTTGKYDTDFANKFVRFIGQAHKDAVSLKAKDRIKLGDCDVTTRKSNDGKWYTDFLVYSYEFESSAPETNANGDTFMTIPDDAIDDLPFC